jgi:hypothetical protein
LNINKVCETKLNEIMGLNLMFPSYHTFGEKKDLGLDSKGLSKRVAIPMRASKPRNLDPSSVTDLAIADPSVADPPSEGPSSGQKRKASEPKSTPRAKQPRSPGSGSKVMQATGQSGRIPSDLSSALFSSVVSATPGSESPGGTGQDKGKAKVMADLCGFNPSSDEED